MFRKSAGPVDLRDIRLWWEYVVGASWRHPAGHGSSTEGLGGHPVVQVAGEDVSAYAQWAGKQIPAEAEWEFASRGGLDGAVFSWGEKHFPGGHAMANTWHGTAREPAHPLPTGGRLRQSHRDVAARARLEALGDAHLLLHRQQQ